MSSDEEDGTSAMLNENMDRTTVSLQHVHFVMPLEDNGGTSEGTIYTRLRVDKEEPQPSTTKQTMHLQTF